MSHQQTNTNSKKTVFLITNGCPENRIDMALIHEFFKKNNWHIVDNYFDAELILFNACALTQFSEKRSLQIIETLKTFKPSGSQLIVCGCLPKINESKLKKIHQGLILYGEHETYKLNDIIQAKYKIEEISANFLYPQKKLKRKPTKSKIYPGLIEHIFQECSEFRSKFSRILWGPLIIYNNWLNIKVNIKGQCIFFIKIATGCMNCCSYCAIKNSRGNLKSKALTRILDEFQLGLQQGYKNFTLLGTDLGPYGKDIGIDLTTLLREMIRENGDYTIHIRNLGPNCLKKMWSELKEILKSKKITFIGIPIQSGNNDILNAMRRGYTIEDVKECIKQLNEEFPFVFIRTQLMTGFPGETLEQFYDTYNLLDELFFDYTEVYSFSTRPNTLAAKMENQLPTREKVRRRNKLWLKALLKNTPQRLSKIYKNQSSITYAKRLSIKASSIQAGDKIVAAEDEYI